MADEIDNLARAELIFRLHAHAEIEDEAHANDIWLAITEIQDLGNLISELSETLAGGPITGPVKTEAPSLGIIEALENLTAEVKLIDNKVTAETRLARCAAEDALAKWRKDG